MMTALSGLEVFNADFEKKHIAIAYNTKQFMNILLLNRNLSKKMKKIILLFLCILFKLSCGVSQNLKIDMVYVEGGEMVIGNDTCKANKRHLVKLSSFYCSKYKVTMYQFKEFLKESNLPFDWDWDDGDGYGVFNNTVPSDDCPANGFNWFYACAFCNWLSKKHGFEECYSFLETITGEIDNNYVEWNRSANGYRLPTSAEWEYAARGGRLSNFYDYPGSNILDEVFLKKRTAYPVGMTKPNELGIYDFLCGISEYCYDWYEVDYIPEIINPCNDTNKFIGNTLKVVRGNNYRYPVSFRNKTDEAIDGYPPQSIYIAGIRLVRNVELSK